MDCAATRLRISYLMSQIVPMLTEIADLNAHTCGELSADLGHINAELTKSIESMENPGVNDVEMVNDDNQPNITNTSTTIDSTNVTTRRNGAKRLGSELDNSQAAIIPTSKQHKPNDEDDANVTFVDLTSCPLAQMVHIEPKMDSTSQGAAKESSKVLMRSVYVSKFIAATDPKHLIECLNQSANLKPLTSQFVIKKLGKNRKSKVPANWVSFKLDVPRQHYNKVIAKSVWPKGVTAKEFISKPIQAPKNSAIKQKGKPATPSAGKSFKPTKNSPLAKMVHHTQPDKQNKGRTRMNNQMQPKDTLSRTGTHHQPDVLNMFKGFISALEGLQPGFRK